MFVRLGFLIIVMNGNVGTNDSRPWSEPSRKEGFDTRLENQFAVLEISSRGAK